MSVYVPYTYLITCIPTGQFYYGVRYRKGCHPDELWVSYFTSSRYVKRLILRYGMSEFRTEVRRTFSDAVTAVKWEHTVLKRMRVLGKPEWLNMSIGTLKSTRNEMLSKHNVYQKGHKRSQAEVEKRATNYETVVWIKKDGVDKLVKETDVPYYLSLGFSEGRSFVTEAFREKCKQRVGSANPAYGRKRADLAERNGIPSRWITNGSESKKVPDSDLAEYLNAGWVTGRHGTKLATGTVADIKYYLLSGEHSHSALGKLFGVSTSMIQQISQEKTWKQVHPADHPTRIL